MNFIFDILPYLHPDIAKPLESRSKQMNITEIRLSACAPVMICDSGGLVPLTSGGATVKTDKITFEHTLRALTGGSPYSVLHSLLQGFVTIGGGHRVGVCGTAVCDADGARSIRDISSVCFRVSRSVRGCGSNLAYAMCSGGRVQSSLIVSPPGYGKTTVLRDLCRIFSGDSSPCGIKRVGIADERGEIASVSGGVPRFEFGEGCFVCTGYSKKHAFLSMLRSMSPEVLATDEIGTQEDFESVCEAVRCGVSVIATAHAGDIADLRSRFGERLRCFEEVFFIGNKNSTFSTYRRCKGDY